MRFLVIKKNILKNFENQILYTKLTTVKMLEFKLFDCVVSILQNIAVKIDGDVGHL